MFSCESKKDDFTYQTSIGSLTYQADLNYLNTTLKQYANLSDTGLYFWKQDSILELKVLELKNEFNNSKSISSQLQSGFFDYFEKVFNKSDFIDFKIFNHLKSNPIKKLSDIDLLELYIKRGFVSILSDNKLFPFDTVGTMLAPEKSNIKNGEEYILRMNMTASNSKEPPQWYIVKDGSIGLTKDNIIDTIQSPEYGDLIFKTKKYHPGENEINVIVRLRTHYGEQLLSKTILFYVQ